MTINDIEPNELVKLYFVTKIILGDKKNPPDYPGKQLHSLSS